MERAGQTKEEIHAGRGDGGQNGVCGLYSPAESRETCIELENRQA